MTETVPPSPDPARFRVLVLLFLVYSFNFIDRQILGILAAPIKAELHLSDTELGLLGGLSFALLYTTLGVPIAWLADRTSRTWIITAALAVWSGFTALCGAAHSFLQLFLTRVGVGVGEAGGVAPSYALIADYFPPKERARALAFYSFGIPVGSAVGIALGGVLAGLINWRVAFFAVGAMGLILAPFFRWLVRDPKRASVAALASPQAGASETIGSLLAKPSFWLLSFGAASSSIMGYGIFFWAPSFLQRSYHMTLQQAGLSYAALVLVGGVIGVWLGGAVADWLGARSRAAYALIPAAAFVLTTPCYAIGLLSPSPVIAFLAFLPPTALALAWLGPVLTAVQHLAAARMRATASALFLFINNLIGLGLGTVLIGALSDGLHKRFGDEALRYSILAGSGFYLLAALFLALAARYLRRDWCD